MGLDIVLECENQLQEEPRPKVVHQSPCSRTKVDEKDIKALLKSKYYNLRTVICDPIESELHHSTSIHRKSMPARPHRLKSKTSESLKRASVYQSSRESRSMRKSRDGRRNVEPAFNDESFLSFDIVDPSPPVSFSSESATPSVEFLELSFRDIPNEQSKLGSSCSGSDPLLNSVEDDLLELNSDKNKVFDTETSGNHLFQRDSTYNLPKSFSAKAVMSNSPCQPERETSKASPKSLFTPFKKILDPIMKSKSLRNASLKETEIGGSTAVNSPNIKRQRGFRKSLLNDFSKVAEKTDFDEVSVTISSPAHLHAILKLESKNGTPSYEFATKDPEDVLLAKTWRSDSAFNWVYTFHNVKKSKEKHGHSPPMVGQMQVSCYLCSEVNAAGSLEISTVTEFVLYDIARARRSFAIDEESQRSSDFTIGDSLVTESPSKDLESDPSSSYPWAPADLHPHLEITSIVIQVPFTKKEVKDLQKGEVEKCGKEHPNLTNVTPPGRDTMFECMNRANVKVVTPSGKHGLSTEEGNPSSLLDRWRFGGGCDCGGWDMGCPIVVFDKPYSKDVSDYYSATRSHQQILLFVQGRKEEIPALSILSDGKGQYSVDFHAQLSSLQAFSICIAILHSSEAASALLGQDKSTQRLYSSSLKLLLEEEVRHLIEAVAAEEKRKAKKKSMEQIPPPSFILNSPFSPIGRV